MHTGQLNFVYDKTGIMSTVWVRKTAKSTTTTEKKNALTAQQR